MDRKCVSRNSLRTRPPVADPGTLSSGLGSSRSTPSRRSPTAKAAWQLGHGGLTRVGDDGLFMMGVHVGHDCVIGDHVILANNASLGGHCRIEDHVVVGALAGVHQFCRVGRGAMIGGLAAVVADVIPYGTVMGERATLEGLNLVGLKRRGADRNDINGLRSAFKLLFTGSGSLRERASTMQLEYASNALVQDVTGFILEDSSRHVTTGKGS